MHARQLGEHRPPPLGPLGRQPLNGQGEYLLGAIGRRRGADHSPRTNHCRSAAHDDEHDERNDEETAYGAPRIIG
jgi:hypothetical protein